MQTFDYRGRVERLRDSMGVRNVDAVLISVGPDLQYLTGYDATESERLTVLVVRRRGDPVLIVPRLEAPRVDVGDFELLAWDETESPVERVGVVVGSPVSVAVGTHMWAVFLLAFQRLWPMASFEPADGLTGPLRLKKDKSEIEALRMAAHAVDRVMERIPGEVAFRGRTEREVARALGDLTVEEGHDVAGFAIVGSGPNGASPHHEASDRVIEVGDLVVCDFGGRRDGYWSDSTRTFVVGEPSPEQIEIHSVVLAANQAGRDKVAPGVPCQEVDRAARKVIEAAGHGEHFIHRTGHGIGLEVHEDPYLVMGNEQPLDPGMTFSVEPGVYIPGRLGIRIEDIVLCGANGADALNTSSRGLVSVG